MNTVFDLARVGAGSVLLLLGTAWLVLSVIGVVRMPDFFSRLHVQRAGDVIGSVIVVSGLALFCESWALAIKVLALGALIVAAAPLIARMAAGGAHAAGLAPLTGAYAAPRPDGSLRANPTEPERER